MLVSIFVTLSNVDRVGSIYLHFMKMFEKIVSATEEFAVDENIREARIMGSHVHTLPEVFSVRRFKQKG